MEKKPRDSIDLAELTARIRAWQKEHDTPRKVAAAHRKVLLDRVVESMVFEGEKVNKARLKALFKPRKKTVSGQ